MGHGHLTASEGGSASGGRLGWRSCLRKGCSRTFQARRYNQRYCQDPECIREVRRWQGAKRQRKCRSQAEGRQRHAEAERQRRKQRASAVSTPPQNEFVAGDVPAENGAWSRSRRHPQIFCDRPGRYEPPRDSPRAPASYCGDDCRAAMRQARDRERKCSAAQDRSGPIQAAPGIPGRPGQTSWRPCRLRRDDGGTNLSVVGYEAGAPSGFGPFLSARW